MVASVGEGAQSAIYKTSDAGQHWRLAWANPHAKGFFDALAFWDGRRGLVLSDPVEGSFRLFATSGQDGPTALHEWPHSSVIVASFWIWMRRLSTRLT